MSALLTTTVVLALLGSALIAGVFFAFSSFIMRALAERPAPEAIAAMQSINAVVINRSFLGTFVGTAMISLVIALIAVVEWQAATSPWLVNGALLYVGGTFLVTIRGNVPLNNRLASLAAEEPEASSVWTDYLNRWTRLNTIRAVAATAAMLAYLAGLLSQ